MLQPHNYSQIQHRNLYDVAYRRTGIYKGMGQGIDTSTLWNLPNTSPLASAYGSNFGEAALQPGAGWMVPSAFYQTAPGAGGTNISSYLPWMIGGGLLLVLLLAGKR